MSTPFVRFTDDPDPALARALEGLRDVVMRHPIAVQAAFAALAAEGRRFAETEDGAEWKERLSRSDLAARLRIVWESLGMTAFVEKPTEALPSFFLDGIVRAAAEDGLETLLSEAFDGKL